MTTLPEPDFQGTFAIYTKPNGDMAFAIRAVDQEGKVTEQTETFPSFAVKMLLNGKGPLAGLSKLLGK